MPIESYGTHTVYADYIECQCGKRINNGGHIEFIKIIYPLTPSLYGDMLNRFGIRCYENKEFIYMCDTCFMHYYDRGDVI